MALCNDHFFNLFVKEAWEIPISLAHSASIFVSLLNVIKIFLLVFFDCILGVAQQQFANS